MSNKIKIILDKKIYNLESVLNTCYKFVDCYYLFLDSDYKNEKIIIYLKGKRQLSRKKMELLKGKFMNELLYWLLRYKISKDNKKIREYIIGRALYSFTDNTEFLNSQSKFDFKDDSLGIAAPWEEKYGKKEKKNARVKV